MKKTYLLFAIAMFAVLSLVSCKSNKSNQPTPEDVKEMKLALADSVLAQIDALEADFQDAAGKSILFAQIALTDKEKMVKPDYLLDPAEVDNFVTKDQKVSALAFYILEKNLRKAYEMPTDAAEAAISKLLVDINYPLDEELIKSDAPISEKIKSEYELCSERGEQDLYWRFQYSLLCDMNYLLASNPDLFFSKITDDNISAYDRQWAKCFEAIKYLAAYDEEMDELFIAEASRSNGLSTEEIRARFANVDAAKATFKSNEFHPIEWRNSLLK